MGITINNQVRNKLKSLGIETLSSDGAVVLPDDFELEAPCSLKWTIFDGPYARMGAYSYIVSGYVFGAKIGRYVSMGENIQIGRQNHPMDWLSTSPVFYLWEKMFDVGNNFVGAGEYNKFVPDLLGKVQATKFIPTEIGKDVWVGHGAIICAGVKIGNGAIVAQGSVVTKDVPPYAIVAGNPAVVKKYRFSELEIERLLHSQWWDYNLMDLDMLGVNDTVAFLDKLFSKKMKKFQYQIIKKDDIL